MVVVKDVVIVLTRMVLLFLADVDVAAAVASDMLLVLPSQSTVTVFGADESVVVVVEDSLEHSVIVTVFLVGDGSEHSVFVTVSSFVGELLLLLEEKEEQVVTVTVFVMLFR